MNIGREIISCILSTQALRPFLDAGLDRPWLEAPDDGSPAVFDGPDYEAYEYILSHWEKFRKVPSLTLFQDNYPAEAFRLSNNDHIPGELVDKAVGEVRRLLLAESVSTAVDLYEEGRIEDAADQVTALARRLDRGVHTQRATMLRIGDEQGFDMQEFLNREITMGVPLGLDPIDAEFYGWQPGQLITFLGRQKATKTTLALWSAFSAWAAGHTAHFYSVELDTDILLQRILSMGAGINPEHFRRGGLTKTEKEAIDGMWHEFEEDTESTITISKHHIHLSVTDIEKDIETLSPGVVYIDGFYFMRDRITGDTANEWKANENIATELKALALDTGVPIVVTTQVQEKQHNKGKKGIQADTIQAGTGLLKASDLVLGIDRDDDKGTILLDQVYNRYSPISPLEIEWDWDTMYPDLLTPAARAATVVTGKL